MEFDLTQELSELVGVIIGDGCIYGNFGRYLVMITGHICDDKEYYEYLCSIYRRLNMNPRVKIHWNGLRLIVQNKVFYKFLVDDLNMKYRTKKTYEVQIPLPILLSTRENIFSCPRGIFNSDGTIFTANKPGSPNYPSIEITTVSKRLAYQIESILQKYNFSVRLRYYDPKNGQIRTYKIALNGVAMVTKWYSEIGATHYIKKAKMERILNGVGVDRTRDTSRIC